VTTRFPAGLTILSGTGQFRDLETEKIVREKSMVLILLYPLSAWEESNEKIEQIRKEYKKRFKQQSVLRVDESRPVLVSF
jgi:putative IMPACT (imprinted ancient) family translation regulator